MTTEIAYKPRHKITGKEKIKFSGIKNVSFLPYLLTAQQIAGRGSITDTTITLYEVPSGYTFFVTHLNLTVRNQNAGGITSERGEIYLNEQSFLFTYTDVIQWKVTTLTANFSIPYKLNSHEKIKLESSSAGGRSHGGYVGFLVKTSDLIF